MIYSTAISSSATACINLPFTNATASVPSSEPPNRDKSNVLNVVFGTLGIAVAVAGVAAAVYYGRQQVNKNRRGSGSVGRKQDVERDADKGSDGVKMSVGTQQEQ